MSGYTTWDRTAYVERIGGEEEAEARRKVMAQQNDYPCADEVYPRRPLTPTPPTITRRRVPRDYHLAMAVKKHSVALDPDVAVAAASVERSAKSPSACLSDAARTRPAHRRLALTDVQRATADRHLDGLIG